MCWKVEFIDDRDISGYALDAMRKKKLQSRSELGQKRYLMDQRQEGPTQ
jgi:hypothetical protein